MQIAVPGQLMQEPHETRNLHMSDNKTYAGWWLGGVLCFAVVVMLFPVLSIRPLLQYDDVALINALKDINSLSSWFGHFMQGQAVDLQPVRDITYLFDLWIQNQIGFRVHHFTNLILYLWLGHLVYKICGEVGCRPRTQAWAAAIFLVHPIHIETVAWVSGRKFLLAGALLAYATLFALRIGAQASRTAISSRNYIFLVTAFVVSILSQPIGILLILWVLWFLYPQRKNLPFVALCFTLGITGALFLGANLLYYAFVFVDQSGFEKFQDFSFHRGMAVFWSMGRSVFNLIVPFRLSILYNQTAVWNFIGLGIILSALFVFLLVKKRKSSINSGPDGKRTGARSFALWTLLVYLPVSNMIPTNIFTADRYLFVPSIGIVILFALWWDKQDTHHISFSSIFPATIAASFFLQALLQAQLWTSEERLFTAAHTVEPYWQTCLWAGEIALQQGDIASARHEFASVQEDYPEAPMLAKNLTRLALHAPLRDVENELMRVLAVRPQSPFPLWELAKIKKSQNALQDSLSLYLKALTAKEVLYRHEFEALRKECHALCQRLQCGLESTLTKYTAQEELAKELVKLRLAGTR
jgi:protein O-mannosyl-transferase